MEARKVRAVSHRARGNLSALVVDDHPLLAEAMADRLLLDGFETDTATTGAEALKAVDGPPRDLIFIDLNLPDASGLSVAAELKKHWPDSFIVLITGNPLKQSDPLVARAGINAVLLKPWKPAELAAILTKYLGG